MNTAYIYDIDSILKIEQKPWVISKDNPNIPLMKINESDFNLFKSGIYKNHGNKINFNSSTFWVSNSFMNKLKVKCKLNDIDISNLGISMQEYLNSSIIENIDYKINLDIFKESFNKECDIFVVLSKSNKEKYKFLLEKIDEKILEELGLKINAYIFLSESFFNRNDDEILLKKSKLILEKLNGLKTEDNKFTNDIINYYETINYYDTSLTGINFLKNINYIFDKFINNTEKDISEGIKNSLDNKDKTIILNYVSNNKSNRITKSEIKLKYDNVIKFQKFSYISESIFSNIEKRDSFKKFIKSNGSKTNVEKILYQIFSNLGYIMDDLRVSYISSGKYGHTFKFLHPIKNTWCVLKITSDVNEFNNSKLLSGKNIKGVVNFYECYPIEGATTRKKGIEIFAIVMELLTPLKSKDILNIKKIIRWYHKNYEENSSVIKHFLKDGLSKDDWNVIYDMNLNQNPFSFLMHRINTIKEDIPDNLFSDLNYSKDEFLKLMNFVISTQKRLSRYKIPGADIHIGNIGIKNGEYKLFDLGVDSKIEHIDIDKIQIK